MRVSHTAGHMSAVFDDPNLVSCAGVGPVVALAARCGLAELVASRLTSSRQGRRQGSPQGAVSVPLRPWA